VTTHVHVFDLAGVCTGPGPCDTTSRDRSPKQNWVDKVGGMPAYIKAIRNALLRKGHSMPRATALAVGTAKNWASGKGNVSAATRARAAKAVAEWEAMKGRAHSMSVPSQRAVDLAAKKQKAPASDPKVKAAQDAQQQQIQGGSGDFNSKHPRAGAGGPTGGQFITLGSGGASASQDEQDQVKAAQFALGIGLTGQMSKDDVEAIKSYQKANGLQVDGKIGAQTAAALAETNDAGGGDPNAGRKAASVKPGALSDSDRKRLVKSHKAAADRVGRFQNSTLSMSASGRYTVSLAGGAMPGGRFPVPDRTHLKKAVLAYGRAKPEDKPKVKRHIKARAKALGAAHMLPEGWK
jgi:hypothetical protein